MKNDVCFEIKCAIIISIPSIKMIKYIINSNNKILQKIDYNKYLLCLYIFIIYKFIIIYFFYFFYIKYYIFNILNKYFILDN